jgi:mannosyl-oligosaccharide alpha-1,2-mannosidase
MKYSSWRLLPKQDFLVCFFAGNLLLSATRAGSLVDDVSVPPRGEELSDVGRRDWTTGIELIRTCMATHDTKTHVLPGLAIKMLLIVFAQRTRTGNCTFQDPQ